jgi:hypothetical protein
MRLLQITAIQDRLAVTVVILIPEVLLAEHTKLRHPEIIQATAILTKAGAEVRVQRQEFLRKEVQEIIIPAIAVLQKAVAPRDEAVITDLVVFQIETVAEMQPFFLYCINLTREKSWYIC